MSESFRKHIKKQHFPAHPSSIKFWTQFRNCIHEALKKRDWKEADSDGDWDLCWVEKETVQDLFGHLTAGQRINHFRNHYEITRKDLLIKNLKRHKKALEKEGKLDEAASYNFFPITYNLPNEYTIFSDEFKKANHNIWIMKPIGKSQGKGIFLFKKLSQISDWKLKEDNSQVENYIVQRYIHNPLLIGGKKFDLRIYCLVTSYSPLTAYLYRDGFARFTHHRYDNTDISNSYVHLTNVAIQKHSENYDKKLGGKWDLRTLKLYLTSKYGHEAVNLCFASIQQVIIKTLLSVQKVIIQDKHCFELYGFDILIDANLKPWVLEVNGSPSMTANTNQDNELKCGLLDDVFTVIDMEKILTGQEEQIGGFDLICKGEPITNNGTDINLSMLGCHNNRIQQIRSLAKVISMRLAQIHQRKKELNGETKKSKDKDKDKEKEKDTVHPLPIALSTDTLANARKNRSKSTGKGGSIGSQTGMPAVKIPPVRTSFNPKVVLAPLSQDGRENREIKENREVREGRALVQKQQPVRLYKGKTVDLPPVSNPNPNNVSVQNLVLKLNQAPAPVIVSNNQSIVTQNLLSNSGLLVKNTNSIVANSGISRSYSNLNQSEISLKQHIQSKIATQTHISNLNNSSANLIIMGSSPPQEKGLKSEQRDFSPLQVTRILKPHKAQSDKNLLSAQWHPAEAYNYSIEKPGLGDHTTRRDSKHNIKDVYTPEGSTKSFTNTGKPTSKSEFPSHTNLYLSNNEPSASKYGGGTSHRDSRLNSE